MLSWVFLSLLSVANPKTYEVSFVSCYDADTCYFNFNLGLNVSVQNQAIRFCDVNAPELEGTTKEAGVRSRDAMVAWLKAAKVIQVWVPQKDNCVQSCDKKDKYGRWLAWVIADGINLNKKLVEDGLAVSYIECK